MCSHYLCANNMYMSECPGFSLLCGDMYQFSMVCATCNLLAYIHVYAVLSSNIDGASCGGIDAIIILVMAIMWFRVKMINSSQILEHQFITYTCLKNEDKIGNIGHFLYEFFHQMPAIWKPCAWCVVCQAGCGTLLHYESHTIYCPNKLFNFKVHWPKTFAFTDYWENQPRVNTLQKKISI